MLFQNRYKDMKQIRRLFLILCFSLAAASSVSAGPIRPTDASHYVGKKVTVTGKVSQVHTDKRSGVTFINMGGRYPANVFTGVIFRDYIGQFPQVHSLEGRAVSITGTVMLYKGKPEIILRDKAQLTRP